MRRRQQQHQGPDHQPSAVSTTQHQGQEDDPLWSCRGDGTYASWRLVVAGNLDDAPGQRLR